jgi:hypothetical protein
MTITCLLLGIHSNLIIPKNPFMMWFQVQNRSGEWIYATPIPGTFVCNIGDMLKVYLLFFFADCFNNQQLTCYCSWSRFGRMEFINPRFIELSTTRLVTAYPLHSSTRYYKSLACSHVNLLLLLIFFSETNGTVKLWCCHRACSVLPGENWRCCEVWKGGVRGAFGKESPDKLRHVNFLGADAVGIMLLKYWICDISSIKHVCPFVSFQWFYKCLIQPYLLCTTV